MEDVPTSKPGDGLPQSVSRWSRNASAVGLIICDLVSAVLSQYPLMGLYLVALDVFSDKAMSDVFDDLTPAHVALLGFVGLVLALAPAAVGNLALGTKAGWPIWLRTVVATIIVPAPFLLVIVPG